MIVEFEHDGTTCRGKVVGTIVEEKSVNIREEVQVIRFVVLLKDGTFTSVPIKECRKMRSWWIRFFRTFKAFKGYASKLSLVSIKRFISMNQLSRLNLPTQPPQFTNSAASI